MKLKKFITFTLYILCIIALIWFSLPTVKYGILNLGNTSGITASILSLCIISTRKKIKGISKGRLYKFIISMYAVAGLLIVIMSVCIYLAAHKKPGEDATVIVLGAKVIGYTPCRDFNIISLDFYK